MCRPAGFQSFVFVDGTFAGTISPTPMNSRTDGAGNVLSFGRETLVAFYVRYRPTDPLCCPSLPSSIVEFRIAHGDAGPVLIPTARREAGPPQSQTPVAPAGQSATHEGLTVTVLAVERPWHEPNSFSKPAAGMEYLTVEVRLDNATGQQIEHNPAEFKVATADGARWDRRIRRDPPLQSGHVLPGTPMRGWLTFEVPIGNPVIQLLWAPGIRQTYVIQL
jgi:hypothetical protein